MEQFFTIVGLAVFLGGLLWGLWTFLHKPKKRGTTKPGGTGGKAK